MRPTGFEPAAYRVGVCHSIQLSYERKYILRTAEAVVNLLKNSSQTVVNGGFFSFHQARKAR